MSEKFSKVQGFDAVEEVRKLLDAGMDIDMQLTNGQTLLHHAAMHKQLGVAEYLLQRGADVLIGDNRGYTPLHVALMIKHYEMLTVIVENTRRDKLRKLLDMRTKTLGDSALHIAIKRNCKQHASILLGFGANYEIRNYARKRPVDVAATGEVRQLVQMMDGFFTKAKQGDQVLLYELSKYHDDDFLSTVIMNCRNNKGRTIMQELIANDHYELMALALSCRADRLTKICLTLGNPNKTHDMGLLLKAINSFRYYWRLKEKAILELYQYIAPKGKLNRAQLLKVFMYGRHASVPMGKMACDAIKQAHEVLAMYHEFEGKDKSLTTDAGMKTVEEVLEVLGLDPDQSYETADYYERLPTKYKESVSWLLILIDHAIDVSFHFLLRNLYSLVIIESVKFNSIDRVKLMLDRGGSLYCLDHRNLSALCYAAEQTNEEMIELLIKSGSVITATGLISPVWLAVNCGNEISLKCILKHVGPKLIPKLVDYRQASAMTALHMATMKGRLDLVKILMSHGATYNVTNEYGQTPLNVSTNQEVSSFLQMVDEFFEDIKATALCKVLNKLNDLSLDEFLAAACTRNNEGHTLAVVAAKLGAKKIALIILKRIAAAKNDQQ